MLFFHHRNVGKSDRHVWSCRELRQRFVFRIRKSQRRATRGVAPFKPVSPGLQTFRCIFIMRTFFSYFIQLFLGIILLRKRRGKVNFQKQQQQQNIMLRTYKQTIAFAFDYSAKRLLAFQEYLDQNAQVRKKMDRRAKLRALCETRWVSIRLTLHVPSLCSVPSRSSGA